MLLMHIHQYYYFFVHFHLEILYFEILFLNSDFFVQSVLYYFLLFLQKLHYIHHTQTQMMNLLLLLHIHLHSHLSFLRSSRLLNLLRHRSNQLRIHLVLFQIYILRFVFLVLNALYLLIHLSLLQLLHLFSKTLHRPPPATIILDFKLSKSFHSPDTSLISVAPPPSSC